MNSLRQKTTMLKPGENEEKCFVINADGKILGKVAAKAASVLRGKHKATYTPRSYSGDKVIIINAQKIRVTGKKLTDKVYQYYTGYPSGRRVKPLADMLKDKSTTVMKLAIKRMIPHGPMGYMALKNLKVYAGAEHPHQAQKPVPLEF